MKKRRKKSKEISIGKIVMIILGLLAGPLEFLTLYLINGNKETTGFFPKLKIQPHHKGVVF